MHQRVCAVLQLIALLDELSCCSSRLTHSPAHFSRKRRAAVEMVPEPLGQIHSATRTQVRATAHKVCREFVPPKVLGALGALDHYMLGTVREEKRTLFLAQDARPLTVGV
jgi:hypothetical protein